jgi:hypothetical protein
MCSPFNRFDGELKLLRPFANDRLLGRFVETAVAACQAAIGRTETGRAITLRAVERDNPLVRPPRVLRRRFVHLNARTGRFGGNQEEERTWELVIVELLNG